MPHSHSLPSVGLFEFWNPKFDGRHLEQDVQDVAEYLLAHGVAYENTRLQEDRISVYENPVWGERYPVEYVGPEENIDEAFTELNALLSNGVAKQKAEALAKAKGSKPKR